VSEDARCGGIGRKLIDHVIADARKNSASRVHWMTHETNKTAQRLYDKYTQRSGFISYRVHLQEHYINL
jgi:ribosomal protein S18 acetylase RimI-like enzyme